MHAQAALSQPCRSLCRLIKLRIERNSSWIEVALNAMTGVLVRDTGGETQRSSHAEMEAEMGETQPQA